MISLASHWFISRRTLLRLLVAAIALQNAPVVRGTGGSARDSNSFRAPDPYDLEELYQQTKVACPEATLPCLTAQFQSATARHGPRAAIDLFTLLKSRGDIEPSVDGHHIVHHIGHETAMDFGPTAQALALCPASYNYGCVHGFFQHALGMGAISESAAAKMCDGLWRNPTLPLKTVQSCYHGLGHGIMLHADYDLPKALKTCDKLILLTAQESCWQGVFMENVDAALEGREQKGLFALEDSLAPCDHVGEKYRYQCFMNQSSWLMKVYQRDVSQAAQACLKASATSVAPCLQAIGLLTTSAAWQPVLLRKDERKTFLEDAWTICQRFPEDSVGQCVVGALDNLMNSGTVDIQQARAFCNIVGENYRTVCSDRIGGDLRYLAIQTRPDSDRRVKLVGPR
jgi:hypothetical protein